MMGLGRRPGLAGTATLLARLPFKGRMHRGSGGGQLEPEVSWLYSRILAETYWGPFWIAETLEHCPQPLSLPRLSPRTEKKARGTVAAQLFRLQNSTWGFVLLPLGGSGFGSSSEVAPGSGNSHLGTPSQPGEQVCPFGGPALPNPPHVFLTNS